jgi:hypothetical protein
MELKALTRKLFTPAFDAFDFAEAIEQDNAAYVAKILKYHPTAANWTDDKGRSALNLAVEQRRPNVAKLLIAAGADIEHPDPRCSDMRPLHRCLMMNDEDIAEALVDKGADVNARDGLDQTAFYMGVSEGHEPLLRKMIAKKADIDVVCGDTTPLMLAAMADNKEAIRLLVHKGADIGIRKSNGVTADQLARSKEMEEYLGRVKNEYDALHSAEAKAKAALDARLADERRKAAEQAAITATIDSMTSGAAAPVKPLKRLRLSRPAQ